MNYVAQFLAGVWVHFCENKKKNCLQILLTYMKSPPPLREKLTIDFVSFNYLFWIGAEDDRFASESCLQQHVIFTVYL